MARPHPALIELAAGRPLPPVRDWSGLVESAHEHRMIGLLSSWVTTTEVAAPGWVHDELTREGLSTWARHARMWKTLCRITERLDDAGIEVVTAKGVAAEARWYQRMGDRPCRDIDLVLAPHQRDRIGEVMGLLQPDHFLLTEVGSLVRAGLLQSVDLLVDEIEIDLHVDILKLGIPSRGVEAVWRTVPLTAPDGTTIRVLDPEASLLVFLIHLNKDRFRSLLSFVDVHRILDQEEPDWDFIWGFVHREGLEVHTALTVKAVASILGFDPPSVPATRGTRALLWKALWRPSVRLQGDLSRLIAKRSQFWIPFLARGRFPEAIRWWLRTAFPPRALVDAYLPGTRGPYLWRLLTGRLRDAYRRRRAARSLRTSPPGSLGDR